MLVEKGDTRGPCRERETHTHTNAHLNHGLRRDLCQHFDMFRTLNNVSLSLKYKNKRKKRFGLRFQIQRFHAESSENFTLLEEMSSLTDTTNENEDTGYRRGGHSAHSAHLGRAIYKCEVFRFLNEKSATFHRSCPHGKKTLD